MKLIIRLWYHRVNPPLLTPAARSSTSPPPPPPPHLLLFLFHFLLLLLLLAVSSPASSPPDRIFGMPSNADYKPPGFMSIPGIGPRKKGRDTTMFFFRLPAILTTPRFFRAPAIGLSRKPDKSSSRERIRDGYRMHGEHLRVFNTKTCSSIFKPFT